MAVQGRTSMVEKSIRTPTMSFILRLWPGDGLVPELRGEIEHIRTGEKRFFQDHWGLLHLLETWTDDRQHAG
jgi:hypothetical protein